ncbi:katanin p60 ATPase-containing subunit A-like 2 [Copidosoma floridanum]|uniref:katanin p60 ATPase-containing subunit A-like 2 n=1 Tax=Copidosoma floridanum TaxID=29053 RepID=UPI000C6F9103|nr:katanin p60 ATPase-containing subunit A-like 2 [Copidosoma floridanum]
MSRISAMVVKVCEDDPHKGIFTEEKRAQERKKNLLYLIAEFLYENCYVDSCEVFLREARLALDVEVCDNVDLDTILLEYFEYYFTKYSKYPKICKKGEPSFASVASKKDRSRTARKSPQKLDEVAEVVDPTSASKKSSNEKFDPTFNITVTQLFPPEYSAIEGTQDKRGGPKSLKPLGNLYPPGSEWREIADVIVKEIVLDNLNVHWNDVKGLDSCKNLLKEAAVYPIKYPCMFNERLTPWKGVLLYGPPGTGKTMLAKAVATECNATFFNITSSSLISKWRGESEKYVRVLSDLAKYYAPSIIFIDEVDWTVSGGDSSSKSEPSRRFRAELLARLDGLLSMETVNVLLLAATNIPWELDKALLRRLEKHIYVGLPDEQARDDILKTYLKPKLLKSVEYKDILVNTKGYSCADLRLLCREAWMIQLRPVWDYLENENLSLNEYKNEGVNDIEHVKQAMKYVKPTVKKMLLKYQEWNDYFSDAENNDEYDDDGNAITKTAGEVHHYMLSRC